AGADLEVTAADFFHDGNRAVLTGRPPGSKEAHLYVLPLDGGSPVAMSDAGVFQWYYVAVSSDDRFVAAWNSDEMLTLHPTDGGTPLSFPELGKNTEAVAWAPEGNLWVRPGIIQELPNRILLYDVFNRRVLKERPFSLNDATGVLSVAQTRATPDGNAIAFDYERVIGHLYLLHGLASRRQSDFP